MILDKMNGEAGFANITRTCGDDPGKYDSAREYHKALMGKFGDWQPPKPIVKIPQFMADWFEYQLKNNNDLDKFDGNDVFRIV